MKVLITGVTGFVGSHLVEYIHEQHPETEIHGIKRWRSNTNNVNHLDGMITYHDCDIKDAHNVNNLINDIKPDRIFHLAAQSFVPTSWESPSETFEINIIGQCNIFESVRKIQSKTYNPAIQIACSSEEYGLVLPLEVPIKETNPLRPLSPYAVSKVAQDFMGYQYFKSYGLQIIRTRAFNHSGPRRGEVFVDSNFAKQIAEIEIGKHPSVIEVGNLEAIRDFTDVRDIVEAYWLSTYKCVPGEEYNICSGRGYKIEDVLNHLISLSTSHNITIHKNPNRARPSDVPILIGDNSKFKKATGWSPKIDYMTKTLADTMDFWRARVRSKE